VTDGCPWNRATATVYWDEPLDYCVGSHDLVGSEQSSPYDGLDVWRSVIVDFTLEWARRSMSEDRWSLILPLSTGCRVEVETIVDFASVRAEGYPVRTLFYCLWCCVGRMERIFIDNLILYSWTRQQARPQPAMSNRNWLLLNVNYSISTFQLNDSTY